MTPETRQQLAVRLERTANFLGNLGLMCKDTHALRQVDAADIARLMRDAADLLREEPVQAHCSTTDLLREHDALLDLVQMAANDGAWICPLAGQPDKPEYHARWCPACQVQALLAGRRYVAPETEMLARASRRSLLLDDGVRRAHYYGEPLRVAVEDGALVICIGVQTLAHAASYSDWANPYDDERGDYFRTFAITDAVGFANDVRRMLLDEREDGSSLLSGVLDKAMEAAVDDGSEHCEYEQKILHGQTSPLETWAGNSRVDPPSSGEKG